MEQKRVPEAAPEWPSVELGIGEKRSFRKGSKSAFNYETRTSSPFARHDIDKMTPKYV
jgi:hypothetical protein